MCVYSATYVVQGAYYSVSAYNCMGAYTQETAVCSTYGAYIHRVPFLVVGLLSQFMVIGNFLTMNILYNYRYRQRP